MALDPEVTNNARMVRAIKLERLNKKVMQEFASRFKDQDIQNEQWSYVNGGVMVTYSECGHQETMTFNEKGKWLFTISYLEEQELPERTRLLIKSGFKNYQIFGIEAITSPSANVFLAHIQNANSWKILRINGENVEIDQELTKSE